MHETSTLLVIATTFLLAGSVKGVIGLGLPTLSLGLLAAVFDLPTAMALLIFPSFVTNLWQAAVGGNAKRLLKRLWPFLALATLSIGIGTTAFRVVDPRYLSMLLGMLLLIYSLVSLSGFQPSLSPRNETWAAPLFGSINGLLTGMTGSFVVPGVMYLQAIGLPRDSLIQAMGMLFSLSTLGLFFSLQKHDLLTPELTTLSALAVAPALLGMVIGQTIRRSLPERRFRQLLWLGISVLGLFIIGKSLFALSA